RPLSAMAGSVRLIKAGRRAGQHMWPRPHVCPGDAMFPLLIRNLLHLLGLPAGADEPVTSLAIDEQWVVHIGCEDDMVTVLLPLGPAPDPLPGTALANSLAQWPPVLLDLSEQGEAILWAREHVGRL